MYLSVFYRLRNWVVNNNSMRLPSLKLINKTYEFSIYVSTFGKHSSEVFDPRFSSDNYLRYFGKLSFKDFEFGPVTKDTIRNIVISLKSSSSGCDEIPIEVYKEYFNLFGHVLTKICNSSLPTGQFPVDHCKGEVSIQG